jgi:hypothetical protein
MVLSFGFLFILTIIPHTLTSIISYIAKPTEFLDSASIGVQVYICIILGYIEVDNIHFFLDSQSILLRTMNKFVLLLTICFLGARASRS